LARKLEYQKHQNNILIEEAENRTSKQKALKRFIMRTITLLVASILLTANVTKANETKSFNSLNVTRDRFDINEPISFTERGIAFFVFANGDFDFNSHPDDSHGTYQYKQAGRRAAVTDNRGDGNFGVLIERDNFGRIRRVGNTFINYDNRDRVSRIGTVFMTYNRIGLTQIGGMRIVYNRRGDIVDMIGEVKGRKNYGVAYTSYGNYNNDRDYSSNNNNDFYYYKADGTKAVVEDDKKEERR
jgi:hypothetical protein